MGMEPPILGGSARVSARGGTVLTPHTRTLREAQPNLEPQRLEGLSSHRGSRKGLHGLRERELQDGGGGAGKGGAEGSRTASWKQTERLEAGRGGAQAGGAAQGPGQRQV